MTTLRDSQLIGCWIDGAFPRTQKERNQKLLDLLQILSSDKYTALSKDANTIDDDQLDDLETDIIEAIESILPAGLFLFLEAGDVIITTQEHVE